MTSRVRYSGPITWAAGIPYASALLEPSVALQNLETHGNITFLLMVSVMEKKSGAIVAKISDEGSIACNGTS